MISLRLPTLLLIATATGARAAPLDVQVRGADDRPIADAVVTLKIARAAAGPVRFPWPYVVRQQNINFDPHVLIVPVGATVTFPNFDRVRHHVYSFSKTRKFELKLFGREETRTVVFDKPGVVAIGCNIHDAMSGYILVVDTPYAARTDASGRARIDLPPGPATLTVWHPRVRAPGNQLVQSLSVPPTGLVRTVTIGP